MQKILVPKFLAHTHMRLKCILKLESKDFVENVKYWARLSNKICTKLVCFIRRKEHGILFLISDLLCHFKVVHTGLNYVQVKRTLFLEVY